MSTKKTIAHGPQFHVYQEAFDSKAVYVQIDTFLSLKLVDGRVTVAMSPTLLDTITRAWHNNRDQFDTEDLLDFGASHLHNLLLDQQRNKEFPNEYGNQD